MTQIQFDKVIQGLFIKYPKLYDYMKKGHVSIIIGESDIIKKYEKQKEIVEEINNSKEIDISYSNKKEEVIIGKTVNDYSNIENLKNDIFSGNFDEKKFKKLMEQQIPDKTMKNLEKTNSYNRAI